ncbi:MAG: guanylate kinase [Polyangiaceae bacterium]|nr:guanylate kinase [Polyangiaceae bacterium]
MSSEGPLLIIISSPSGAGKTTLTTRLRERVPNLRFSISHTTRQRRPNEEDGREYHFVSRETFERLIQLDEFLEWAEVHGNLYGTSRREVESARGSRGLIFDIDHQGARQIKSVHAEAVSVFILPPSMAVLERRLRGRATEDEETVQRRFRVAREEIDHYGFFDYLLVNEDLEEATLNLVGIFRAEECRRQRMARRAEALLGEGRALGPKQTG